METPTAIYNEMDLLTPMLEAAPQIENYKILKLSYVHIWNSERVWDKDLEFGAEGDRRYRIESACFKYRKNESDRMIKGGITVYNTTTQMMSEKSLYRNNKGMYFKDTGPYGKKATVYVVLEPLPENLKNS